MFGPLLCGCHLYTLLPKTVVSGRHKSSRHRMKVKINPLMAPGSCPSSWKKEAAPAIEAEQGFRAPSFPAVITLSSLHGLYIYGTSFVLLQLENLLLCYPIQDDRFERNLQGHQVHFQLENSSAGPSFHKYAEIYLMTISDPSRRQSHLLNAASITNA